MPQICCVLPHKDGPSGCNFPCRAVPAKKFMGSGALAAREQTYSCLVALCKARIAQSAGLHAHKKTYSVTQRQEQP